MSRQSVRTRRMAERRGRYAVKQPGELARVRTIEGATATVPLDEEARLFMVLPDHYKPVVTVALHTGLRLGELRAQRWADVDLLAGNLTVTSPKSRKPESLPLNKTARGVLAELERTDPLVFPKLPKKLSDLFIRYVRKAGLSDVTFHCLRDTFI